MNNLMRKFKFENKTQATPKLYLCDFGFGIQRYDIDKICITERISRDGIYEGNGLACEFNFRLLEWTRRVKDFLKEVSV